MAKPQQKTVTSEDLVRDYKKSQNTQQIHFLSLKSSSNDGYEQALKQLSGRIITMTTTSQHLIVVTE